MCKVTWWIFFRHNVQKQANKVLSHKLDWSRSRNELLPQSVSPCPQSFFKKLPVTTIECSNDRFNSKEFLYDLDQDIIKDAIYKNENKHYGMLP